MLLTGAIIIIRMTSRFIYTQPDVSQCDLNDYAPLEHHAWDRLFSSSDPVALSWILDETCPKVPQTTEAVDFAGVLNQLISSGM